MTTPNRTVPAVAALSAERTHHYDGSGASPLHVRCPHCHNPVDIVGEASLADILCSSCGSSFSLMRDTYATPTVKNIGRFELVERLGTGGFGTVWKARDTQLDRTVAIKIPREGRLITPELEQSFIREARAAAQLKHPGIVSVHEVGRHEDTIYIVVDLVRGATLSEWLSSAQPTSREAAEICAKIADALHHAHQSGVVHRDLKPSNIMIDLDGAPHIMDFGLARRDAGEVTVTVDGQMLGTPAYMSPEQARGEAHQADRRSDVYSLGVVLFQLLTGEVPFRGHARMLVVHILRDEPPKPRSLRAGIPRDLQTICLKCLEKDPAKRYATAADLADDLRRYLRGEPIHARPISRVARTWRWCKRNRTLATMSTAILLLLCAGLAGITWNYWQAESARKDLVDNREQLEANLYFHRIALAHREILAGNLLTAEELLDQCPSDRRAWEWFYLNRLCHVDPVTLHGQPESMQAVALSPDGLRLATANDDKSLKIWHTTTGQELLTIPEVGEVRCAVFRPPDGRWLVTGDTSGAITIWDTSTRQLVRKLHQHSSVVTALSFSPDGQLLASASEDTTVVLWDATTGNLLHHLKEHYRPVATVAFSPDGQHLASAGFDTTVKLWDTRSGETTDTFRGHTDPVSGVAFSPDGGRLASASFDGTVKIWDVKAGQEDFTLRGHTLELNGVAFIDGGRRLASISCDKTMKIWDSNTGQAVLTLRGHTHEITALACSLDGRRIASASGDKATRIWDATTPEGVDASQEALTLRGHTDQIMSLAFSPDGQRLASAGWDATVRIWNARTGSEDFIFRKHNRIVFSVAFSPDGRRIASSSPRLAEHEPSYLKVWDSTTGEEVLSLPSDNVEAFVLAFSPNDGRWLVTVGRRGIVTVWNATTGQIAHTLSANGSWVFGLAFSRDGGRLATLSREGIVTVFDTSRWDEKIPQEPLFTFDVHKTSIRGSLVFSPDGRQIVVPGDENTVNIWEMPRLDERPASAPKLILRGHTAQVFGVAFSPDGHWIASGGEDNTVKLWDSEAGGKPVRTFRGHKGAIFRVAFRPPDGKQLASASFDGTVRLWNIPTPDELAAQGVDTRRSGNSKLDRSP